MLEAAAETHTSSMDGLFASLLLVSQISFLHNVDAQGMSAFLFATYNNLPDHMHLLLKRGADATQADRSGKTAAHYAACHVRFYLL
jgi:ankyrin repeat protein